jgi:hypothetical protein
MKELLGNLKRTLANVVGAKEPRPPAARRVLFVCMGNICRSPTAEGVLRKLLVQSQRRPRKSARPGRDDVSSDDSGQVHRLA